MNYVIANKTDEQVKKGEKYPILSMHDGMINIDVHGIMICFNAEDNDFTVCLNDNENKVYTQEDRKEELNMLINNIDNISSCTNEELKILARQALRLNEKGATDEQPLRHLIDVDGTNIAVLSVTMKIFLECTKRWVKENN